MQRHVYHLSRKGVVHYDEVSDFVVVAASQDEARRMASDDAGDEGAYTWVYPDTSSCVAIGTALPDAVPGPVVRSFHAG